MLKRRGLLVGLFTGPAIIRTPGLLMPVSTLADRLPQDWLPCDGQPFDPRIYPKLAGVLGDRYGADVPNLGPNGAGYVIATRPLAYTAADGGKITIPAGTLILKIQQQGLIYGNTV